MALHPVKQNQVFNLPTLDDQVLENIFSVYLEGDKYYYNLLSTVTFPEDIDPTFFDFYTIKQGDLWITISNTVYNTIKLWWLICAANQIQNPLEMPKSGTKIKILNSLAVNDVLQQMNIS